MKDMHSHILYGIDDGCEDLEESIRLLKEMKESGINEVIFTPHYIEDSKYDCNNKKKLKIYNEIQKKAKEENIDITMYLGNEVFITSNFIELIENDEIWTLNGSKYLLFELPMKSTYQYTLEVISHLISKGYIPVLAHPERYPFIQEHPRIIEEYLRSGILLQANIPSLFGKYGKTAEKTLKYFLKNKWVSFMGSDIHHSVKFNEKKLRKKLKSITKDNDYIENLLNNNFDKVIKNKDIAMIR